jgi:hypothetical protein
MARKANGALANAVTSPVLAVQRKEGRIWSHLRQMWLNETPEEGVRQEYLRTDRTSFIGLPPQHR